MKILDTVLGKFFPTTFRDEDERPGFDLWRLPNDPENPHVAAVRDLFVETFGMAPDQFDACLRPEDGLRRLLVVAARDNLMCGGLIYQMADNPNRSVDRQIDGGYINFIATQKKVRAQGAGRALLAIADADFIVNGHSVSRLIRLDPRHTSFFEAAGYQRTEGGGYGDMHKNLDLSPESRGAAQDLLNGLMTLY